MIIAFTAFQNDETVDRSNSSVDARLLLQSKALSTAKSELFGLGVEIGRKHCKDYL
jgi:hypothetical protein